MQDEDNVEAEKEAEEAVEEESEVEETEVDEEEVEIDVAEFAHQRVEDKDEEVDHEHPLGQPEVIAVLVAGPDSAPAPVMVPNSLCQSKWVKAIALAR